MMIAGGRAACDRCRREIRTTDAGAAKIGRMYPVDDYGQETAESTHLCGACAGRLGIPRRADEAGGRDGMDAWERAEMNGMDPWGQRRATIPSWEARQMREAGMRESDFH